MQFVPFTPAHLNALQTEETEAWLAPLLERPELAFRLGEEGLAWTGVVNGVVVGAAGVARVWRGRGVAWALMHILPRPAWLAATRMAQRTLDDAHRRGIRRIEATVVHDFVAGHRWAQLLGFHPYARLVAYDPDGRDHVGYERLRWPISA
ncbi:MAG: hypothetical protein ACM3N5_11670 [Candidatus Eiseniibacteriota bacterium]